ncbi:hypothetical protein [Nonomuraea jabiensis]|uniref:hypothetical protein n=1 Tax=Nonomuraea jabiensis TaxID=882448 RepID=UPI003D7360AE
MSYEAVQAAALSVFGRYGYRRTSMELIAHDAIAAAEAARRSGAPIADRLYDVLATKIDLFAGGVEAQFRAELLAEAEVIAQDVMAAFESGYSTVVEATLKDARDELDLLDVVLSSHDAAAVLGDALAGIAGAKAEPAVLRTRLRQFAELTVRGLTSKPVPAR